MTKRKLYESPLVNLNELHLNGMDVLAASTIVGENSFVGDDYDFAGGQWW